MIKKCVLYLPFSLQKNISDKKPALIKMKSSKILARDQNSISAYLLAFSNGTPHIINLKHPVYKLQTISSHNI